MISPSASCSLGRRTSHYSRMTDTSDVEFQLVRTRAGHSSYKRGCQGKNSSPHLGRRGCGALHPAPPHIIRGVIGLVALARRTARSSGNVNLSCLSQLDDFMKQWADAIWFRSYASEALAMVPTMTLCETRAAAWMVEVRWNPKAPE
jgi:hypothetical protein